MTPLASPHASALRPYQPMTDGGPIKRIWNEAFDAIWPLDGLRLTATLQELARQDGSGCRVVVVNEQLVGVAAWQQNPHRPTEGSIVLVLVDPRYRRQRLGTALVAAALEDLRSRGVTDVVLGEWAYPQLWHGVPVDCDAAHRFFRALGWAVFEENADLVVDLPVFVWSSSLKERVSAAGVRLRSATDDDRQGLIEAVRSEHVSFAPYFLDELARHGADRIRVATRGERIEGAIITARFPECPGAQWYRLLGRDMCAMGALFVRREARRQGIGAALCAHTLEGLKREGHGACYLEWATLIGMYERLGGRVWRRYRQARKVLVRGRAPR
jgi:GNAT superfamily N-acetyltransferase